MKSYKSRKLPYIEIEKNIITKESPKKLLLNSEKLKDTTTTPSRIPSCISTSQEYQIENNKFQKSKSSQKQNKLKNDFIIFKNYFNNNNNSINTVIPKKSKDNKNNVKKTLSVDKIGKSNTNINKNNNTKSFIEKNLYKEENVKNEINDIIKNFVDKNLQNSKNCNFFRLFKMKRKNQNNKENENLFPPLYNSPPVETEQNIMDKSKNGNKYINLLTKPNNDNTLHYRDTLINSVNKSKLKENRIFIKIDEHFNKLKNDKSPKMLKKGFQGVIKNIKSNNLNNSKNNKNHINNLINISANSKNIKSNNDIKEDNITKSNYKSITTEKNTDNEKYSKELNIITNTKSYYKTPSSEEKIKNLYLKKKNRIKIKISTPLTDNIYTNKKGFEILKKNERANVNRKKTPNIIINNITYTLKIKNKDNKNIKKQQINFENDVNKIKNKKIEKVDDNVIGDSFREELNIIISDVNNCNKYVQNNEIKINDKKVDDSVEDYVEDVKLNLNYNNDESMEKNIPKEHEERIKLIKKYNRPETSYGNKK